MDYIEKWFNSLIKKELHTVTNEVKITGICKKHTGPMFFYAAVEIKMEVSKEIQFGDQLTEKKRQRMLREGWYDEVLYGVMDILLVQPMAPIGRFKLTILDVDFHDIDSCKMAFRLAARDAAMKYLGTKSASPGTAITAGVETSQTVDEDVEKC